MRPAGRQLELVRGLLAQEFLVQEPVEKIDRIAESRSRGGCTRQRRKYGRIIGGRLVSACPSGAKVQGKLVLR